MSKAVHWLLELSVNNGQLRCAQRAGCVELFLLFAHFR